jgi:prepilin peptidase CpaA
MHFILNHWPLWFICLAMVTAAVIDGWKLKVPNWLTFPLVLSGWGLGLLHSFGLLEGTGDGGVGASLAATAIGFALLFPVYAIGGMGAGDVKMQMGFGAWIGAFCGVGEGMKLVLVAFCIAVVLGGLIAIGMMALRGDFRKNWSNTRAILADWMTAGSVGRVADRAAERKPRMHLLPYGIPLCLGALTTLLFWEQIRLYI